MRYLCTICLLLVASLSFAGQGLMPGMGQVTYNSAPAGGYPTESYGWAFNNNLYNSVGGKDLVNTGGVGAFSATSPPEGTHYRTAPNNNDLTIASPSGFEVGPQDYSFSMWVYTESTNEITLFYGDTTDYNNSYYMKLQNETNLVQVFHVLGGTFSQPATTNAVATSTWTLITTSYDYSAGEVTVWASAATFGSVINGEVLTIGQPGIDTAATKFQVSKVNSGNGQTNGVDDAKIWIGTALSATQAETLFDSY